MLTATDSRRLSWSLYDLAGGRRFRRNGQRVLASLQAADLEKWFPVLEPILLVEMHERRTWFRTLEWIAHWLSRALRLPTRFTLVPLQLRNAPWRLDLAAIAAVQELETSGCTHVASEGNLGRVARAWNGATSRQPGAVMGYAQALICARTALQARSSRRAGGVGGIRARAGRHGAGWVPVPEPERGRVDELQLPSAIALDGRDPGGRG